MATRLSKKNQGDEAAQEAPTQRKQAEGRYRLQVDWQTKATYPTWEAAEKAARTTRDSSALEQILMRRGRIAEETAHLEEARRCYTESYEISRGLGNRSSPGPPHWARCPPRYRPFWD